MAENKRRGLDSADDFWDLDSLMPPRSVPPRRANDVETVEISLDQPKPMQSEGMNSEPTRSTELKYPPITASNNTGSRKIDFEEWLRRKRSAEARFDELSDGDEVFSYTPANPLIYGVTVVRKNSYGQIFERAVSDMKKMFSERADFTGNVEFTAFFPQYSRMTDQQRQCYFGFRALVRQGRFPNVDESYILLLLYEIINLSELIPPEHGRDMICALMVGYKGCSDSLFTSMCDWLEDYCLIYKLPAPTDRLEPVRERLYRRATWKEFYVPFRADLATPDACVMVASASSYDYRSSSYYTKDTAEVFERHIPNAVGAAISAFSAPDNVGDEVEKRDVTKLTHEAFRGAYRSADMRYTVSVECACFTRSPLLRQTVTGMVKYAENFVRELLGVKARLTVSCIGTEKKKLIKEYFAPFIKRESDAPPLRRGRKKIIRPQLPAEPQIPDYERLYEPEKREFSHEIAKQIESESWKTTDMLLGAFSDDEKGDEFDSRSNGGGAQSALTDESPIDASSGFGKATPQQAESPLLGGSEDDRSGNSGEAADHRVNPGDSAQKKPKKTDLTKEGLRFLLQGRVSDFRALAIESGILPETLADRINELAIDSYGDIGISSADGFKVIEDYREELLELISG